MVAVHALVMLLTVAPVEEDVAQVVQMSGQVSVVHTHEAQDAVPLDLGAKVHQQDKISTQSNSLVRLLMNDGSVLDLGPDTSISIETFRKQSETRFAVRLRTWIGRMWAHVPPREDGDPDFVVTTSNAVAGVRGTSFVVDASDPETTTITTATGHVSISPGYLLGDAQPTEIFAMQAAAVQGTSWPPTIAPVNPAALRDLRASLTPPPVLDNATQYERMERVEGQTPMQGSPHGASLPLQVLPTALPGAVAPPINLDLGARTTRINATIQFNP